MGHCADLARDGAVRVPTVSGLRVFGFFEGSPRRYCDWLELLRERNPEEFERKVRAGVEPVTRL